MSAVPEDTVEELTREEGRELFDATARHFLGVSGDDFLRSWDAGDYENDDRSEVYHVAMLIPFVR